MKLKFVNFYGNARFTAHRTIVKKFIGIPIISNHPKY